VPDKPPGEEIAQCGGRSAQQREDNGRTGNFSGAAGQTGNGIGRA
jgi:hypothetical protein